MGNGERGWTTTTHPLDTDGQIISLAVKRSLKENHVGGVNENDYHQCQTCYHTHTSVVGRLLHSI